MGTPPDDLDRRTFLQAAGAAAFGLPVAGSAGQAAAQPAAAPAPAALGAVTVPQNMLGEFGPWARDLLGEGPPRLSFRRPEFDRRGIADWRSRARDRVRDCIASPESGGVPKAEVVRKAALDGVEAELLRWQLPYGPPTAAVFLKPAGARERLPAVLALHDHSGKKYFGHRKIARLDEDVHPLVREHVTENYGGLWWANELARRGYAVLAPDAFLFGSRRVRLPDVPRVLSGLLVEPPDPEEGREIVSYNRWAAQHEHVVARSLLCAGTTLPGVVLGEDQRALDYLCSRDEVDPGRVGCCGLSSGGLRTLYLAGLDDRIAAAVCVGMMTTWRRLLLLEVVHAHVDDLPAGAAPRPGLSGNSRPEGAAADARAKLPAGPALLHSRGRPGRPDARRDLPEGRRRAPVPVLLLSGRPPLRPRHAGRGVRLARRTPGPPVAAGPAIRVSSR